MAESPLATNDAPSSSEIEAQLERVLASSDFDVPDRARQFLKYIVTETLCGRADRIKAYSIAVEVFGRGPSFDAQSDPVVRIEAGRVRRALERYYLTAGADDPILITIPKGSYVPLFAGRLAAKTIAETKSASVPEPSHRTSLRTLGLVLLAVIIAGIAALGLSTIRAPNKVETIDDNAGGPNLPKLLVEPFQNVSGTAEGATIAIGLTEEVVSRLARFKDLVVILSDPLRPDLEAPAAIRYGLSGSVRLEGDDVRVSARLVDRSNGAVLWANTYDGSRNVQRALDIETSVARDVATALGPPYGTTFQADAASSTNGAPQDWEAYACTLAYYFYRTVLDETTHTSVKKCLESAVQRFPRYATAWALLSLTYLDGLRFRYGKEATGSDSLDQAMKAARIAVTLDPTNVRALQAQMLAWFFNNEVEAALRIGERAVAINPDDTELTGEFGMRLALSGDWKSGCPLIEQAISRNPAPRGYTDVLLALCSYMQQDYLKALYWVRKADLQGNPVYHFVVGAIAGQLGDAEASEREHQWVLANAPGFLRDIHQELAMRIRTPRDQQLFLDGLRRAGFSVPET